MRKMKLFALLVLVPLVAGCSTVKPYQKEHLTDPIMTSAEETDADMRELMWLEAREGSTGGALTAGKTTMS